MPRQETIVEDALERAFEYYLEHQNELVEKYEGKFVVIKGDTVIAAYDDELLAVSESLKAHKPGTFLVQRVSSGNTAYSQTFHSRVVFA